MRTILFIAILCLFSNMATAQQAGKLKVAVYITGDTESGYKKVIGSKLVSGITRSIEYVAIERTADFLAELGKEQDYQVSGAVSDKQIARIGQQFGVRYVLVADISEIFESMFISARIIDVQTAQIINSTETSGVINNIEGLSKLSEDIVSKIIGDRIIHEDNIKIIKVSTFDDLYDGKWKLDGYHTATDDEIKRIIKSNQIIGKDISFPIYTNIASDRENVIQNIRWIISLDEYPPVTRPATRSCYKYIITGRLITSPIESTTLSLSYIDDNEYQFWLDHSTWWLDVTYMGTSKPSITPGYIYCVKNEK